MVGLFPTSGEVYETAAARIIRTCRNQRLRSSVAAPPERDAQVDVVGGGAPNWEVARVGIRSFHRR
jgi:hypothetical protein